MAKNIVVFCDGTWNSPSTKHPTHVENLAAVTPSTPQQIVKYFPGVGAGVKQSSFVGKQLDKLFGGAFGTGLTRNILDAYKFVAEHYEAGDKIYLFGFSRGAFTVRSLAGLIRKAGLPADPTPEALAKAMKLYRQRGDVNRPDARHIREQRAVLSPEFATSDYDLEERGSTGSIVQIAYLGVWDTVGALGIPNIFGALSNIWNKRHQFHDMELSSSVGSARHAMALDERRYFFKPARWGNLPTLNDGFAATDENRPYQQIWFAGDHGMIGGSGVNRALTSHSMDWVVQGAIAVGMELDPSQVLQGVARDPLARKPLTIRKKFIYRLHKKLFSWRKGPARNAAHTVAPSTRILIEKDAGYRPGSLRRLFPHLY